MKFRKLLGAGLVAALAVAGQAHSAHAEPTDVEYTLELLQPGPGQIVSSGCPRTCDARVPWSVRMSRPGGRVGRGRPRPPRNVRAPQSRVVGNAHPG